MKTFVRFALTGSTLLALAPTLYASAPTAWVIDPGVFQNAVADCEALQSAADAGLPAGAGNPAEAALNSGICLYQLLVKGTDEESMLKAINDLENAQTQGLDRSRQATANLIEGLTSCRIAQIELQPNLPATTAQSPLFCVAKKNAEAAFSRVRTSDLRVVFPQSQSANVSADALVNAMGSCYNATNGPLNQMWTPQCGNFATAQSNVDAAVTAAHTQLYNNYFNGATAPLTAMFSRKKKVADSSLASSSAKMDVLKADAARILADYQLEKPVADQINAQLTPLVQNYQATLVTAQAVVNSYNAWQQGLFVDRGTLHDWSTDVGTAITNLGQTANQFAGSQADTFIVNDAVAALNNRAATQAAILKNARSLCRVYYCELAVRDSLRGNSSMQTVCNFQSSPLCPNGPKLSAGGVTFSPSDFCTAAGFPTAQMTLGMSTTLATQCWAGAQ